MQNVRASVMNNMNKGNVCPIRVKRGQSSTAHEQAAGRGIGTRDYEGTEKIKNTPWED